MRLFTAGLFLKADQHIARLAKFLNAHIPQIKLFEKSTNIPNIGRFRGQDFNGGTADEIDPQIETPAEKQGRRSQDEQQRHHISEAADLHEGDMCIIRDEL
ncbi:hypothetical protein JCM17846_04820 [Iodidimonas nitroreducens]|uniref:Uncharacterized protein n=1 Tax=Iodidimonas nitroreducens TaxID=1236968 RepID=A0A5A7N5W2_9PROT|nr:hypothetical protein [Iodidimonas nitroreducens]GER02800.1 hypothetical protein JCM17846_04820 [Iodidimonas nitroreducens]